MRGRPAKPYLIKVREGNPGHQKLNPGPGYKGEFGSAPSWLGKHGKKLWHELGKELTEQGLSASVYRPSLLGLCANWQRVVECEIILKENGNTFDIMKEAGRDEQGNPKFVRTYVQQRPEVSIAMKAWDKVRTFSAVFGLSPADCQKIVVPKSPQKSLKEELSA